MLGAERKGLSGLEQSLEHALAARLRTCGHFLYYQTGGKTGQRRILATLLSHEGITQKELQGLLKISSGSLSEILQKMEGALLVTRKKRGDDKRRVALSLTSAGRGIAQSAAARYAHTLKRMFECLSIEEQAQLDGMLGKLVLHLDALGDDLPFETEPDGACR